MPRELASAFEALPILVLETVCEYLVTSSASRCDLFAFSLTSKRCCATAARERFERCHFIVEDSQQLEQAIARWDNILQVDNRHRFVRKLKVTGRMGFEGEDQIQANRANQFDLGNDLDEVSDGDDDDGSDQSTLENFARPLPLTMFPGSEPIISPEAKKRNNQSWRPLATFLSACPGFKHLVWASTDQVPRCVLDVLHNQLPNSRIHVNTFSLRSLYQNINDPHDIDYDEYALATSSCLSSIWAVSTRYDSNGLLDFNEEAVLQMVMDTAPHLRSVCMWRQRAGNSPYLLAALRHPRPHWPSFTSAKKKGGDQRSQGQLEVLSFRGESSPSLLTIQHWKHHTNFSRLRSLGFYSPIQPDVLQFLVELAGRGDFGTLQKLSLNINSHPQELVRMLAERLLRAVQPLESLDIREGIRQGIVDSIKEHHGASLRRLCLTSCLTCAEIVDICQTCPSLRDLQVSVKRTQGSNEEVHFYQFLGSMLNLSRLTLLLDCEDSAIKRYPHSEDIERQAQQIRSCLINSAIDDSLALSIFQTILAANRAVQRPGVIPSFQRLKLRFSCGEQWHTFERLQRWLGRNWACERQHADVHSSEVVIREIGAQARLKVQKDWEWCTDDYEVYRSLWEELWPKSKGKVDWINEWHSFPFSGSLGGNNS
ncbi:hypothetical protein BKA66DRAFT_470470 [Pyrenochaeta sp. MPI-SDFR-AT-0127]|nr:hypothetical protein BKA66DRAFT_470470 [Pyrenochaeta sp. MPI-SDFR-AT-0127]